MIEFNKVKINTESIGDIQELIRDAKKSFENVFVEFIGGEPLICIEEIEKIIEKTREFGVFYQITTNGTLITEDNYQKTLKKLDKIHLSYNEIFFKKPELFQKISEVLKDKRSVSVNFIYNPRRNLQEIKEHFASVIEQGYTHINLLPIVLVENYSKEDFTKLIEFIYFAKKFEPQISIEYLYYLQEKDEHFDITIDPSGNILGDNMGTAEAFFGVNKHYCTSIGTLGKSNITEILQKLENYSYIEYLKGIIATGKTKQTYENLLVLSNLLKKFANETRK